MELQVNAGYAIQLPQHPLSNKSTANKIYMYEYISYWRIRPTDGFSSYKFTLTQ